MFFFKKKVITVDCFTDSTSLLKFAPIEHTHKFIPDWWKSFPPEYTTMHRDIPIPTGTIKRCSGFIELFRQGFVVPMWSDCLIKTFKTGEFSAKYSDELTVSSIASHDKRTFGPTFDNYTHMKFVNPWVFKEKTGVNFMFSSVPWYNPELLSKFHIMPGVLNFKTQIQNNVNAFVNKADDVIKLDFRQPLIQLTPLSEHNIKIKCHEVSKEEKLKLVSHYNMTLSFVQGYKKIKNIEEDNKSKCPFKFK
jgi:hypothetical protein